MSKKTYNYITCKTAKINNVKLKHPIHQFNGFKLFTINISHFINLIPFLETLLNTEELNKASRYRFPKDRNRFIICRALLKYILCEIIKLNYNEINFSYNNNKKPYLASHPNIFFNISHANNCALIGITDSEIGVDIEFLNRTFVFNDILFSVFNDEEISIINKSKDKYFSFFEFWTRKEAFVKYLGIGINDSIKNLRISNGTHKIDPTFLPNENNIKVTSFKLNENYTASIVLNDRQKISNTINLYEILPSLIMNK